ncbi:MAG: hypothetical protein ABIO92_03305 [Chloroflexia bacterium]
MAQYRPGRRGQRHRPGSIRIDGNSAANDDTDDSNHTNNDTQRVLQAGGDRLLP